MPGGDEKSDSPGARLTASEVERIGHVGYGSVRVLLQLSRVALGLVVVLSTLLLLGVGVVVAAMGQMLPGVDLPTTTGLFAIGGLALAMVFSHPLRPPGWPVRFLLIVVLGLVVGQAGLRLAGLAGWSVLPGPTGWMAPSVALTVGAIALGQLLRWRIQWLGLVATSIGPILPVTTFIGYSYNLEGFVGAMSPLAAALLLPVALAAGTSFVRARIVRPLLSDTIIGRLARAQIAGALMFPWLAGMILRYLSGGEHTHNGALLTTLLIWFVMTMVVLSALAHERTDVRRRQIERLLRHSSVTDRLTGVTNRYGVALEFAGVLDSGAVGVVIADLDHFKRINDRYGHSVGDRVLVQAAMAMRATLRASDTMARWGGEEFLVVLPGAGPADTQAAAERLRLALKALAGPGGVPGEVTGSFGVSVLGRGEANLEAAILRADTALYHAKGRGRDQVLSEWGVPASGPVAMAPAAGSASTVSVPDPDSLN